MKTALERRKSLIVNGDDAQFCHDCRLRTRSQKRTN